MSTEFPTSLRPPSICPACWRNPVRVPEDRAGVTWYCEHEKVWVVLVGEGANRRWIVRQGVDRATYRAETEAALGGYLLHEALGSRPPALRIELGDGEDESA